MTHRSAKSKEMLFDGVTFFLSIERFFPRLGIPFEHEYNLFLNMYGNRGKFETLQQLYLILCCVRNVAVDDKFIALDVMGFGTTDGDATLLALWRKSYIHKNVRIFLIQSHRYGRPGKWEFCEVTGEIVLLFWNNIISASLKLLD